MSFSSTITITGSTNITNFDIYQCPTSGCTGCVPITGSTGENVSRHKLLTGHTVNVDQGYRYVKLVADTETCNNSICMEVFGMPTFTPTPTPTFTPTPTPTPTFTPTATPIPTSTPTPTATNIPTVTPTPTTNYEFLVCYNPYETALTSVVYTYTQIINAGFTGEPLYSDTITVSGSPNIDAVYQYNGTTSNPTTIPVITSINEWDCSGNPIDPPTPTPTPAPLATFSTATVSGSSFSGGSNTVTTGTTITVINGTATIRLKAWVVTGYRASGTITIGTTYSSGTAGQSYTCGTGEGCSAFTDFNLPIGVYNVTDFSVTAISDGSMTVATAKIEQI